MVLAAAPLDRPFGSSQVLRYRGAIALPQAALSTAYPLAPFTLYTDSALGVPGAGLFECWVRFALFDPNFPTTNPIKTYPQYVYDAGQPAGGQPIPFATGNASTHPGVNASDLRVQAERTWANNLQIYENRIDPNVVTCDLGISPQNDAANTSLGIGPGAFVFLDTPTVGGVGSGLGTGTGLYVACVRYVVKETGGGALQAFNVDMTFEVRHSAIR